MKHVVLSPHLDDAVLSCFHVLWAAKKRGTAHEEKIQASVVNIFAGVPPKGVVGWWDKECGITDARSLVSERVKEDKKALATFGIVPINLGHLDEQYRRVLGSDQNLDRRRIAWDVMRHVRPGDIVYAPMGIGDHPDHLIVNRVAQTLTNFVKVRLYAEFPYYPTIHRQQMNVGERHPVPVDLKMLTIKTYATQWPHFSTPRERMCWDEVTEPLRRRRTAGS